MNSIDIPRIPNPVYIKEQTKDMVKIVNTSKRGKKESFSTKVDLGFINLLVENKENLGDILDIEIDPTTQTLTIHFSKSNKKEESELAHEMR